MRKVQTSNLEIGCSVQPPEPLFRPKAAARQLNVPYEALLRAIAAGAIPSYTFGNQQRRVRLSEVIAFIECSRRGGVR